MEENSNIAQSEENQETNKTTTTNEEKKSDETRGMKVYHPSQGNTKISFDEDENFYEPSGSEIKKTILEQEAKREASEVLQTKEMRDRNKKIRKYERARIRIRFPDRMEVELTFTPTETTESIVSFLKEKVLIHPETPFYLFTTPPHTKLAPKKTLDQQSLVPTAVIHFSYEKAHQNQNKYLREDVLALANVKSIPQPTAESGKEEDKKSTASTTTKAGNALSKAIPKWFKGSSKK